MPGHGSHAWSLTVVLVAAALGACTSWHVETVPAAQVVARRPDALRVQYESGRREVLYRPEIRGDSLVGRRNATAKGPRVALGLADVKGVATNHLDAGRSVGLLLGIGGAAFIAAYAALSNMQGPPDNWGQ